jgi:hypothetical protein
VSKIGFRFVPFTRDTSNPRHISVVSDEPFSAEDGQQGTFFATITPYAFQLISIREDFPKEREIECWATFVEES